MLRIRISIFLGLLDPDPYENVTDPEHWFNCLPSSILPPLLSGFFMLWEKYHVRNHTIVHSKLPLLSFIKFWSGSVFGIRIHLNPDPEPGLKTCHFLKFLAFLAVIWTCLDPDFDGIFLATFLIPFLAKNPSTCCIPKFALLHFFTFWKC